MHDEQFGILGLSPRERIANLENQIERITERGANTPAAKGRLAKLMAIRDALISKAAARKGAALAAAAIPGLSGGLASSGIRGMDVVEHEFTPEVIRQHNLDGSAQGLRQVSIAPPGSGRLVPVNFRNAAGADAVNPVIQLPGNAAGIGAIGATTNLTTVAINWAVVRIVAVTTQTTAVQANAFGLMQDFRIGGSPNLFLVEDWVLMDDYDVDKEQFTGLRAYPILISPNTGLISVAACAALVTAAINCAVSMVVEILRDDAFGPGLPGAYAR